MPEAKHILLTGAAGFIGSHLARRLVEAGHHVLGIDDLSTGSRENLARLGLQADCPPGDGPPPPFRLLVGDASELLSCSLPGPPAGDVLHLAASVGVRRVVGAPSASAENNMALTRAALACAERLGARFVFASSSEVYGKCSKLPCEEEDDLCFGATTSSRWSYGLAKALDEHLVLDFARQTNLRVVVARLFNTVGPGQIASEGMVLPRFVQAAVAGDDLLVYGDGLQSRCFCDVRDTVRALEALADPRNQLEFPVINVGGDVPVDILTLAQLVQAKARESGLPGGSIVHRDPREIYGSNFEDPRQRRPALDRIRSAIGWSPQISLNATIEALLQDAMPLGSHSPEESFS